MKLYLSSRPRKNVGTDCARAFQPRREISIPGLTTPTWQCFENVRVTATKALVGSCFLRKLSSLKLLSETLLPGLEMRRIVSRNNSSPQPPEF